MRFVEFTAALTARRVAIDPQSVSSVYERPNEERSIITVGTEDVVVLGTYDEVLRKLAGDDAESPLKPVGILAGDGDDDHPREDYAYTAQLMRYYVTTKNKPALRALMSNNHNIILAALDIAAGKKP